MTEPVTEEDQRAREAAIAKAEADADAARWAAEKAEADARTALAAARKAEVEASDLESATGREAREAKSRQAVAEAEQKAFAAKQQQASALIPDVSKVKDSTLTVSKDGPPPMGGATLTFGALADAADAIAETMPQRGSAPWRILITSDEDLATGDALYEDVSSGLAQLKAAATELLKDATLESVETAGVLPVVSAIAAAVPHVLSLFSAERTLTGGLVTVSDLAAAAAVAGGIKAKRGKDVILVHDNFRLVPASNIHSASEDVATKRYELVGRKIALADRKASLEGELATAKEAEKKAEKSLLEAPKAQRPKFESDLEDRRKLVVSLTRKVSAAAVRLGLIDSLISAIDTYINALRVVPQGGRRSPLASAALYESLQPNGGSAFTHVLLVKAQQAQAHQVTDDKPLWFKDKFSTIVEVNVTYMLIAVGDSSVERAGTASAVAEVHGDIGSAPNFDTKPFVRGVGTTQNAAAGQSEPDEPMS